MPQEPEILKSRTDDGASVLHDFVETGMQSFHRQYGLWIISSRKEQRLAPVPNPTPRTFTFYAISQILEGAAYYWTPGGKRLYFGPGEAVVMIPGVAHFYSCEQTDYVEDTIRFTGEVARRLEASGVLSPGVAPIGKTRKLIRIMEMAQNPATRSQLQANLALQDLLVEMHLNRTEQASSHVTRIQEITQMVTQDPARWWRVSELAALCSISVNQFRDIFQRETGLTPKRYVDVVRMNFARNLLLTTDANITEIAQRMGYNDPYHFSRRFKQIHGQSPTHSRESHLT